MNKLILLLFNGILFSCSVNNNFVPQKTNPESWDILRPLGNPDKGWYHHMLDNGIGKYLIQDENDLHSFPGIDHLYQLLVWAFLELKEGKINFQPLVENIKLDNQKSYGSIVHLHFSVIDFAPGWMKKYNIPIRNENWLNHNFDFILLAGYQTESIIISFPRVIGL